MVDLLDRADGAWIEDADILGFAGEFGLEGVADGADLGAYKAAAIKWLVDLTNGTIASLGGNVRSPGSPYVTINAAEELPREPFLEALAFDVVIRVIHGTNATGEVEGRLAELERRRGAAWERGLRAALRPATGVSISGAPGAAP